jgi:superoxide dismutase
MMLQPRGRCCTSSSELVVGRVRQQRRELFNKEEPIIFAGTLRVHHGEHHKVYVEKLNDMRNGKMRRDS